MSFDDPDYYPAPKLPAKYLVCPECEHEGPHRDNGCAHSDPSLALVCRECSHEWTPHELWFDDWERDEERRADEPRKRYR